MRRREPTGGLTLVEVLIVLGILGCIVVMLLPAIQSSREAGRRTTCVDNMKRLGLLTHLYHDAHKRFPPSSGVTRDVDGAIAAVDGWSWLVAVLPYWEQAEDARGTAVVARTLYDSLDTAYGRPLAEPAKAQGTPHANVLAVSLAELLCPSSGGGPYAGPATRKEAITNYRATGATHMESLSVASPHPLTPRYGVDKRPPKDWTLLHPDGACFPGDGLRMSEMARKGTSYTSLIVESIEPRFSRWTVGAEAAVVAFPPNVEFESDLREGYTPKGYHKAVEQSPDADSTYWTYRTYLDWDYDRSPYDGADGNQGGQYGPSSGHPDVVNHLSADGCVQAVGRRVDAARYMFYVKRDWWPRSE